MKQLWVPVTFACTDEKRFMVMKNCSKHDPDTKQASSQNGFECSKHDPDTKRQASSKNGIECKDWEQHGILNDGSRVTGLGV